MTPPNPPTPQSVSSTGTGELFEAADRLNDYLLDMKNWPMKDIPDDVYQPFLDALKLSAMPPLLPSQTQGSKRERR